MKHEKKGDLLEIKNSFIKASIHYGFYCVTKDLTRLDLSISNLEQFQPECLEKKERLFYAKVLEEKGEIEKAIKMFPNEIDGNERIHFVVDCLLKNEKHEEIISEIKRNYSNKPLEEWDLFIKLVSSLSKLPSFSENVWKFFDSIVLSIEERKKTLFKLYVYAKINSSSLLEKTKEYLFLFNKKKFCCSDISFILSNLSLEKQKEICFLLLETPEVKEIENIQLLLLLNNLSSNDFSLIKKHIRPKTLLDRLCVYCSEKEEINSILNIEDKKDFDSETRFAFFLFYIRIGMFNKAFKLFNSLEIKNIQQETLFHYMTDSFLVFGRFNFLQSFSKKYFSFMETASNVSKKYTSKMIDNGDYLSVSDCFEFFYTIDNSLYSVLLKLDDCFSLSFEQKTMEGILSCLFKYKEVDVSVLIDKRNISLLNRIDPSLCLSKFCFIKKRKPSFIIERQELLVLIRKLYKENKELEKSVNMFNSLLEKTLIKESETFFYEDCLMVYSCIESCLFSSVIAWIIDKKEKDFSFKKKIKNCLLKNIETLNNIFYKQKQEQTCLIDEWRKTISFFIVLLNKIIFLIE